ncbi:MAG: hypothetical protein V1672_02150 [Candidatus Diapherotrites archaeon]
MEFNIMKSKKGQISIEFMLIILVCLGYLQLLTVNVLEPAIDAAQDTTRLGQTKLSAEKLASAINEMSSSLGEGKRTLHLFVPKESDIVCSSGPPASVAFSVKLYGMPVDACSTDGDSDDTKCTSKINLGAVNLNCGSVNLTNPSTDKGEFFEVSVESDSGDVELN